MTGAGTFMLLGHRIGVIQFMIMALVMIVAGIVLYRLGTRRRRFPTGE
jgi:hypothetical protein